MLLDIEAEKNANPKFIAKILEDHSVDSLFLEIPVSTRWQFLMVLLCSLSSIHSEIFTLSPMFYRFDLDYKCIDSFVHIRNQSDDPENRTSLPEKDWCKVGCSKWVFDYSGLDLTTSLQESYSLVCGKEILLQIHGTCFFLGLLAGSVISGFVSDRIGRVRCLRLTYLLMSTSGVMMALTPNFVIHLISWTINSAAFSGAWVCLVPLTSEIGKNKNRQLNAALICLFAGFGGIFTAPLAYFLPNWRHFVIGIACIVFFAFITSLTIDESPRWLWTKQRYREVYKIAKKAAKIGGKELPPVSKDILEELSRNGCDRKRDASFKTGCFAGGKNRDMPEEAEKHEVSLWNILKYRTLTIRFVLVTFLWVNVNTLFYKVMLGASTFQQQVHLYSIVQGAGSMMSGVLLVSLMRLGRKSLCVTALSLTAVSFLGAIFVPPYLNFVNLLTSFFAKISTRVLLLILYIWTAELMPTVIRASALGFASFISRTGGLAIPFIDILASVNETIPLAIYFLIAALIVVISCFLPETRGKSLPNSMLEANGNDPIPESQEEHV